MADGKGFEREAVGGAGIENVDLVADSNEESVNPGDDRGHGDLALAEVAPIISAHQHAAAKADRIYGVAEDLVPQLKLNHLGATRDGEIPGDLFDGTK